MSYSTWQKRNLRRSLPRQILLWTTLLIMLVLLIQLIPRLFSGMQPGSDDYMEYYSAGQLNLKGLNPYSPDTKAPMWNPPWTLTLVMPMGLLPYLPSRILWLFIHVAVTFISATWAWSYLDGPADKRWIAWIAAFTFGPVLQAFKMGQIVPFLMLGVTGFLYFAQKGKFWLAGAFLALLALKPHMLYLFLVTVGIWSIYKRHWPVLISAIVTVILSTVIAALFNPEVISQYIYVSIHYPPQQYATATIGGALRLAFGIDYFWLQFVPSVFGIIWLLYYLWQKRLDVLGIEPISIILLVSAVTSSYGWTFDLPILIVPMLLALIWSLQTSLSIKLIVLYFLYVILNILIITNQGSQISFWWSATAFLLWYLGAQFLLNNSKEKWMNYGSNHH